MIRKVDLHEHGGPRRRIVSHPFLDVQPTVHLCQGGRGLTIQRPAELVDDGGFGEDVNFLQRGEKSDATGVRSFLVLRGLGWAVGVNEDIFGSVTHKGSKEVHHSHPVEIACH